MTFTRSDALIIQLNDSPQNIEFNDVIEYIDSNFSFEPTAFTNGEIENQAGQNNGSCKLLALGQFLELSDEQTLALFGRYYREDVLQNPAGTDHANIRNFMKTGSAGVNFSQFPLTPKK